MRGVEKPPVGADGKPVMPWQEYAWRRLTEANPLPAVMGRVCPAPCETGCNRNQVEDHVGINSVEHYLGEYAIKNNLQFKKPEKLTGKKVAVIGGGPAGLSVAYQLALKGHSGTIFDDHEYLGGMMRYGIPGYRTPRDVLDAEIQRILDLGVEVKLKMQDRHRHHAWSRFARTSTPCSSASAPRAVAPCRPKVPTTSPNVVTATAFLQGLQRRSPARPSASTSSWSVVATPRWTSPRSPVASATSTNAKPTDWEGAIAGQLAQDVADISNRQGAEVVLTSIFPVDKMMASPG